MTNSYEEKLKEVRAAARRIRERDRKNEEDRNWILTLVPQLFPEPKPYPRGRLNEVVEATGWTREYVARIRDGKVKPS